MGVDNRLVKSRGTACSKPYRGIIVLRQPRSWHDLVLAGPGGGHRGMWSRARADLRAVRRTALASPCHTYGLQSITIIAATQPPKAADVWRGSACPCRAVEPIAGIPPGPIRLLVATSQVRLYEPAHGCPALDWRVILELVWAYPCAHDAP